jgi:hypothetical protein
VADRCCRPAAKAHRSGDGRSPADRRRCRATAPRSNSASHPSTCGESCDGEAGRASSRPSGVAWVSISNSATCLRLTPTGQEHSPSKQLELELGQVSRDYKDHLRVRTANLDDLRAALPTEAVLIEFRQFQRVDFRSGASGEPRRCYSMASTNRWSPMSGRWWRCASRSRRYSPTRLRPRETSPLRRCTDGCSPRSRASSPRPRWSTSPRRAVALGPVSTIEARRRPLSRRTAGGPSAGNRPRPAAPRSGQAGARSAGAGRHRLRGGGNRGRETGERLSHGCRRPGPVRRDHPRRRELGQLWAT